MCCSPRDEKIATVGIYGAKKVVAFAKAFIKARKEAPEDAAGEVSTATKGDDDDQDEGGDEKAAEVGEPRALNHIPYHTCLGLRFSPLAFVYSVGTLETRERRQARV